MLLTERGTTTQQVSRVTTLGEAEALLGAASMLFPSLAVVGLSVALRDELSWYETKPLFGWTALLPRTKDQAGRPANGWPSTGPTPTSSPPSRSSRRDPAADGPRHQGARDGTVRVDRVHPRSTPSAPFVRSSRSRPGRAGVLGAEDRGGRRRHRQRAARLGPRSRPGPLGRAVGRRSARGLAGVRRRPRPDQPGLPPARRHRDRHPRRRSPGDGLGGRRRHGLPDRPPPCRPRRSATRSSRAPTTPSSSPRARRSATSSGSPASRTRRPSWRSSARPRPRRPRRPDWHVDVMAPSVLGRAGRRPGGARPRARRRRAGGRRAGTLGPARRSRPPVAAPADTDRGHAMGVEPQDSAPGGCGRTRPSECWSPRPGCTRGTSYCRSSSSEGVAEPVPISSMPGVVQHTSTRSSRRLARAWRQG